MRVAVREYRVINDKRARIMNDYNPKKNEKKECNINHKKKNVM